MHYLDGFPEVSRVRGVLEGVCSNQHHVQGYPAAPHVRNLSIIVFPRQHLYTTKHVSTRQNFCGMANIRQVQLYSQ